MARNISTSMIGTINIKAFFKLGNLNSFTIDPIIKTDKKSPTNQYLVNINVNMSPAVNANDIRWATLITEKIFFVKIVDAAEQNIILKYKII